jgi:type I restriction enzyme, S subunit
MEQKTKQKLEQIRKGKVPKGYKETKLGIIPEDWSCHKIKETLKICHGKSQKKIESTNGKYPILASGGVIGHTNSYLYNYPSILIGRKGTIDNPAYIENPFWTVDTLFYSKIKEKYMPKFLYYIFCTINWKKYSEGTSLPSLSASTIESIGVSLPKNIEEQDKIAKILSTWDKSISLKEELLKKRNLLKRNLMMNLLTGKIRFPGFEEDWKEIKLGSVFSERKEINQNGAELLSITSSRGIIKRTEIVGKDNSNSDKSKYKKICKGDIGYNTMRMWQGVSGVSDYDGIVSPAYTVVRLKEEGDIRFFKYLFKLEKTINLFWRYSQGLVNDTLNLKYKHFKLVNVKIPKEKEEQKKIADTLEIIDRGIEKLEKEKMVLVKQKKGLMQLLLTGIIRVEVN